jgi:Virulence factor BrkB
VVNFLLSVAPEQLVRPLASEIHSILTVPRTGLLSLAAVLTIWSAMAGVDSIRVGLNRAYNLKEDRNLFWLYGQSILFVIGSAVGLLIVAALIVFTPVLLVAINRFAPALNSNFETLNAALSDCGDTAHSWPVVQPPHSPGKTTWHAGGFTRRAADSSGVDWSLCSLFHLSSQLQQFRLDLCITLRTVCGNVLSLSFGRCSDPWRRSEQGLAGAQAIAMTCRKF